MITDTTLLPNITDEELANLMLEACAETPFQPYSGLFNRIFDAKAQLLLAERNLPQEGHP